MSEEKLPRPNQPENPSDPQSEIVTMGANQLATDLVQLAGTHDPSVIGSHIDTLLAETDSTLVSPEQRAAAVHFLSAEQRDALRTTLNEASHTMVANISANDDKARSTLETSAISAKRRGLAQLEEQHSFNIGRLVRRQSPGKQVAGEHAALSEHIRKTDRTLVDHGGTFGRWIRAQESETDSFTSRFEQAKHHERALDEAEQASLQDDPSEKPRNLSKLIDESVKQAAAEKIVATIASAEGSGASPEAAVAELLMRQPAVQSAAADHGIQFAQNYRNVVGKNNSRVVRLVEDASRGFRRFISSGQDEYYSARREYEVEETFRRQRNLLAQAVQPANDALRYSGQAYHDSQQAVARYNDRVT